MEGAKRNLSSLIDELEVTQFLAAQVAECLKGLLVFGDNSSPNFELGLADLGVESFVVIELQSWWIETLRYARYHSVINQDHVNHGLQ
jgi:hypothetical protein